MHIALTNNTFLTAVSSLGLIDKTAQHIYQFSRKETHIEVHFMQ